MHNTHIVWATNFLAENGIDSAKLNAIRLFEHCVSKPLFLVDDISKDQLELFRKLVHFRSLGHPLQHLVGKAYFRYLELVSSPMAFIPRPETEILIDEVLLYIKGINDSFSKAKTQPNLIVKKTQNNIADHNFRIVDLCTGSGNIAISLATEIPDSIVCAVDISNEALEIAGQNNEKYGNKVKLIKGDVTKNNWLFGNDLDCFLGFDFIGATSQAKDDSKVEPEIGAIFDIVVSNPPYIPSSRVFNNEVSFDPALALYGGGDKGLEIPKKIVDRAFELLKNGGLFLIEHDDTNQKELCDYIVSKGFSLVEPKVDYNGFPRYIKAIL